MRPLPRKSNIHRYPLLKYIAPTARKCTYLWEFRPQNVLVGIWIGWFIALIPIYGGQMFLVFLLCLPFRGNAIIAMALQWITNPLTIPPILFAQYKIGDFLYRFFGGNPPNLDLWSALTESRFWEFVREQVGNSHTVIYLIVAVLGGGLILSLMGATINTVIYLASRRKKSEIPRKS